MFHKKKNVFHLTTSDCMKFCLFNPPTKEMSQEGHSLIHCNSSTVHAINVNQLNLRRTKAAFYTCTDMQQIASVTKLESSLMQNLTVVKG